MTQGQPSDAVELAEGVSVQESALRYAFSRSGGPGGQAVNKLATKAELRVAVEAIDGLSPDARHRLRSLAGRRLTADDDLLITASTHRSQLENRRACVRRLRALVGKAVVEPTPRKPTRPPRSAVEKRLEEKKQRAERKERRRPPPPDKW